MRVLLAGRFAGVPHQGGATWAALQWVLGLRALGHEVVVVEQLPGPADPVQREYARTIDRQTGVTVLLLEHAGPPPELAPLDLLVNLSGVLRDERLLDLVPRRLYVDLDPGFTQVWHAQGADVGLDGHTHHATVGLALGGGCTAPTVDRTWLTLLPPVVLGRWEPQEQTRWDAATSVGHWRSYGPVEWDGLRYGQRAHAVRRLLDLPARSPLPLRPALGIAPEETDDLAALRRCGWQLLDPADVTATPEDYRAFVRGSTCELGTAKAGYVDARTGWFSDRSAAYLAAGRPVVAQDTGWSAQLPTGEGLHAYDDVEGAGAALDAVLSRPAAERRAAVEVARAHLDARTVLGRLLEQVA